MKPYAYGVDVGGTTVKIGLFETKGTLLETWEIKTRTENDGAFILKDIAASIAANMEKCAIKKEDVLGIGLGVPGPVGADGTVFKCVNLGWGIFNVEKEMEACTGFFTKAGNDANVATLGEMWMGGGKGFDHLVMVTFGTGVGGGIIVDGKIIPGFHGAAGEIGHVPVSDDETATCGCGKKGCFEQYASASGVARVARNYLRTHDDETVLRQYDVQKVTSKELFDAAKAGDAVALQLVDDFGKMVAKVLAQVSAVIDPQAFVIGGGLAKAGQILLDSIEKYYAHYAFHACRDTKFALAVLGNEAGMYGGVRMLLD